MTTAAICATREVSWSPSFYRGEQFDPDLGLYYLRARYYNPVTGRFSSRDPEPGKPADPKTLHKYLYAGGDPVNASDPTGRDLFDVVFLDTRSTLEAAVISKKGLGIALCIYGIADAVYGISEGLTLHTAGGGTTAVLGCWLAFFP